jgi:hypothetical protein
VPILPALFVVEAKPTNKPAGFHCADEYPLTLGLVRERGEIVPRLAALSADQGYAAAKWTNSGSRNSPSRSCGWGGRRRPNKGVGKLASTDLFRRLSLERVCLRADTHP